MILLGLILIVVAAGAGTLLFLAAQQATDPIRLEALGVSANVTPLALLIAGAAVVVLLWLGLLMVRGSIRRKARRRREAKELQRQAELDAEARREAEARRDEEARRGEEARREAEGRRDMERRESDARWEAETPTAAMPVPAQRLADTRGDSRDEAPTEAPADTTRETPAEPETSAERAETHPDASRRSDAEWESTQAIPADQRPGVDSSADLRDEPTRADRIMGRDHHESLPSTGGTAGTGTSEDTQGLGASRTEGTDSTNGTNSTDSTDTEEGPDSGRGRSPGAHRA